MRYARLVITAYDEHWLGAAIGEFTGYSASVIACDCEAGQEQRNFLGDDTRWQGWGIRFGVCLL